MHLYPNAFQVGSVKYREYIGNSGRESRAKYFKNRLDGFTSKIDIHEFSVAMPKNGSSWIHKIPILEMFEILELFEIFEISEILNFLRKISKNSKHSRFRG